MKKYLAFVLAALMVFGMLSVAGAEKAPCAHERKLDRRRSAESDLPRAAGLVCCGADLGELQPVYLF